MTMQINSREKTNVGKRYRSLSAERYARVLYELQIPKEAVQESETIFSENPVLCQVFDSPVVSREKKFRLIDRDRKSVV